MSTDINSKFYMGGTEGTGEYVVPVVSNRAAVGFRALSGGSYRVRIEPRSASSAKTLAANFPADSGWKQPGDSDQNRFSLVVHGEEALKETIAAAARAVTRFARTVEVNSEAPDWAAALATAK